MRRVHLAAAVIWAGVTAAAAAQSPARQAAGGPRIWQGVYTADQAERGKGIYEGACIRCHGGDLGGTTAPPLRGDRFFASWGGDTVGRLFEKIRDTMPPNFSTTLDDAAKIRIVAYLLQANGFPAGASDLTPGPDLAAVQILREDEQPRVENFSLIQTVGCLVREQNVWVLRSAATPAATTADTPGAEALVAAAAAPLGGETFELLNAAPFDPAARVGHKVEARGLIYRQTGQALLTVTSLQSVGVC